MIVESVDSGVHLYARVCTFAFHWCNVLTMHQSSTSTRTHTYTGASFLDLSATAVFYFINLFFSLLSPHIIYPLNSVVPGVTSVLKQVAFPCTRNLVAQFDSSNNLARSQLAFAAFAASPPPPITISLGGKEKKERKIYITIILFVSNINPFFLPV